MKGDTCILIAMILLLLSATVPPLWVNRTAKASDGATLTGGIHDYGLDTDGDGLYNYLVVKLEANVYTAGTYCLKVYGLGSEYERVWISTFNRTYLQPGPQNISIRFVGAAIRNAHIKVTKLVDVYLYGENYYLIDYRPELNLTKTYDYTQFDEAATLTGTICDSGVDTDNDGLFNYLNVSVEVNVMDGGLYEVYISGLRNGSYNYVYVYGNAKASLTTGTHWLSIPLDGLRIYASLVTNITIINFISLSLIDEFTYVSYQIDATYNVQLSKSYNYTDFEYFARLTGNIYDEGVDTDSNGLFNYLKVGVEIEVAEESNYAIGVYYLSEDGRNLYVYQTAWPHLNVGTHTVYFEFYGQMLVYNHFSPQSLSGINLFEVNTWTRLDHIDSIQLSRKYDYTLFDAPSEDMQVNFTVYPDGTIALSGLFNYTNMYPPNTGPLMNASLNLSTAGSTTTGSLSGVLILPTDGMFQWPFNSTTVLFKSKIQNGLSNTTLALIMLMPPAASETYPFNTSNFELTGRYDNGMLNFNLFGETKLPTSLRSMLPFNATDITVKADFENGEFAGNITFYLLPFIPGFLDVVVDFDGNQTELRLTDHINITYGNYPPPIGKINSTILEGLLTQLNNTLPGPNGLIANMTDGLIICTQLNTTKTEWPDGNGAEIRYNATLHGNFTMLFAKLLNQMIFGGSHQTEQFTFAILDSVYSSIEKASLMLNYYHELGQASADMAVSCNVAKLWENALERIPPTVPPDYRAQVTALIKILNATAYAIKKFDLDMQYSSNTQKLTLNALSLINSTQLEGDIIPLLPEIAPTEQLRQILEEYLSVKYCNITMYNAIINYANGRADFTATWTLEGDFKAELNHIKRFYIDYWNATNPWHMPWQYRMLNETVIDMNNFSAEFKFGRDWMLLRFNGLIIKPPINPVDNVRFKLWRFFNMTSYDPYEPPREFQKLKVTITGAFNGTHTTLLYAPGSITPPDFVSTDLKTMMWENVSISSLKDLEFRIAYQQVIQYIGTHNVIIFTNSTMSNFNFNPNLPGISFNVSGATGTGFCQIAIQRTLLYANPSEWIVKIDGQTLTYSSNYTVTENDDYVFIVLNYTHSTHRIEIAGTWVISEFNTNTVLIILVTLALMMAILAIHQRKNLAKMKMKCKNITSTFILKITNRRTL